MDRWIRGFGRLTRGQKLAVAAMLLLVILTWLAVCLVLAGVPGS